MVPFESRGRGSPGFRVSRGGGGGRGRGGPSPNFRGGGRGGASPGGFRGRGGSFRGGRGSPAFRGRGGGRKFGTPGEKKKKVVPHERLEGVYIEKGKTESLCTKSLVPGVKVYGEKRIVEEENGEKVEYRVWNPFRSKLAAAILGGIENIYIKPGSKVLYLGAASGTTVSHVSDIVGPEGKVYAVEFSHRCGRDLMAVAQRQRNIVPLVLDARQPLKYRMVIWGMVDVIFSDVAQPDQARILGLNAEMFLKTGGHFLIAIKASCIDSSAAPEAVFASEVSKLREQRLKPIEQVTLEPFERDHCVINGIYRPDELGLGPTQKKKRKIEDEEE